MDASWISMKLGLQKIHKNKENSIAIFEKEKFTSANLFTMLSIIEGGYIEYGIYMLFSKIHWTLSQVHQPVQKYSPCYQLLRVAT